MSLYGDGSPAFIDEVFVTAELFSRKPRKTDYQQEKLALQDMAVQMVDHPGDVLPHLVDLAIEICGGVSGGISLFEEDPAPGVFRWHHLRGDLERFSGATTPRHFSPCGVTLDEANPVLVRRPERMYHWLSDNGVSLPECLLVPLYVGDAAPQGTLWIVSAGEGWFDSGHGRVLTELASFAGIALKMLRTEERLQQAFDRQEQLTVEQETLTKEMDHRVKNLFAVVGGMIRISARAARTPEEMAESISGRLAALATAHSVVRRNVDDKRIGGRGSQLDEVIRTILRPHAGASGQGRDAFTIDGPPVMLGDRATNSFALALHELGTNAAKYGAFKSGGGSVQTRWRSDGVHLTLTWQEDGGPAISGEPAKEGFGSALSKSAIVGQMGGTIFHKWRPNGLQVTMCVPLDRLSL